MSKLNSLNVGEMRFLDNSIPQLAAGTYKINIDQSITEKSHKIDNKYSASRQFIVQSPRFSLPSLSVQAEFPTVGSDTDFHLSLPYVVFNDEHLPWCRTISSTTGRAPWLALMVFKADEIIYTAPPVGDNSAASPTRSTIRDIDEVITPDEGIAGPDIELDSIEKGSKEALRPNTIDILVSTFKTLAPTLAELEYLAHVRKINNGGEATDDQAGEQGYSTLLANRLADPATPAPYIAHVVSLEGWADYLPGSTTEHPTNEKMRLVSLYSWNFNNKEGVSFSTLIETMDVNGLKLPFSPPAKWGNDELAYTEAQKATKHKYNDGYIALNYTTRLGEDTFAWYRGPFTPAVPVVIKNVVPASEDGITSNLISSADEAIIYDEKSGIFDQSYAAAWELGRMLTLANRPAALAIWQWKKQGLQKVQTLNVIVSDLRKKQQALTGPETGLPLNALLDGLNWQQVTDDLMDDQAGKYIFMNYLGRALGKHILGTDAADNEPVITVLDPSGLKQHYEEMPGLIPEDVLYAALEEGIDPHMLIADKLNSTPQGN